MQYPGRSFLAIVYDANGNRLTWDLETYDVATNSNRLEGTNAAATSTRTHDGAGNTLTYSSSAWGVVAYAYNTYNQMQSVKLNSSTLGTYGYNVMTQ